MWAATAADRTGTHRRTLAVASPGESGLLEPDNRIILTVQIDLAGESVPPAVLRLVESLHALADPAAATPVGHPAPQRVWPRPEPQLDTREEGRAEARADGCAEARTETREAGGPRVAASGEPWPDGRVIRPRLVRSDGGPVGSGPSLRVYPASRMVLRDGMPVRLTRREYDLLAFLCGHPQRVFSRRQLLRQVWGYEMVSGERTVDVHVRRLRVKLGERGPVIATVRGVGYRLDDATQVTVVPETPPPTG